MKRLCPSVVLALLALAPNVASINDAIEDSTTLSSTSSVSATNSTTTITSTSSKSSTSSSILTTTTTTTIPDTQEDESDEVEEIQEESQKSSTTSTTASSTASSTESSTSSSSSVELSTSSSSITPSDSSISSSVSSIEESSTTSTESSAVESSAQSTDTTNMSTTSTTSTASASNTEEDGEMHIMSAEDILTTPFPTTNLGNGTITGMPGTSTVGSTPNYTVSYTTLPRDDKGIIIPDSWVPGLQTGHENEVYTAWQGPECEGNHTSWNSQYLTELMTLSRNPVRWQQKDIWQGMIPANTDPLTIWSNPTTTNPYTCCGGCWIAWNDVSVRYWPQAGYNTECIAAITDYKFNEAIKQDMDLDTRAAQNTGWLNVKRDEPITRRDEGQVRLKGPDGTTTAFIPLITPGPHIKRQEPGNGTGPSTLVGEDGFIYTSPFIYLEVPKINAPNGCGYVGPQLTNVRLSVMPDRISSLVPANPDHWKCFFDYNRVGQVNDPSCNDFQLQSFDFGHLPCPPESLREWGKHTFIYDSGRPYNPIIAGQGITELNALAPEYASCGLNYAWDPFIALQSQTALLPAPTPGNNVADPVPPTPGQSVDPPIPTPTSAGSNDGGDPGLQAPPESLPVTEPEQDDLPQNDNNGGGGNTGTGNSGNNGNTGNTGNTGGDSNAGNAGNNGNTGNTGNTGSPDNTGSSENTGNGNANDPPAGNSNTGSGSSNGSPGSDGGNANNDPAPNNNPDTPNEPNDPPSLGSIIDNMFGGSPSPKPDTEPTPTGRSFEAGGQTIVVNDEGTFVGGQKLTAGADTTIGGTPIRVPAAVPTPPAGGSSGNTGANSGNGEDIGVSGSASGGSNPGANGAVHAAPGVVGGFGVAPGHAGAGGQAPGVDPGIVPGQAASNENSPEPTPAQGGASNGATTSAGIGFGPALPGGQDSNGQGGEDGAAQPAEDAIVIGDSTFMIPGSGNGSPSTSGVAYATEIPPGQAAPSYTVVEGPIISGGEIIGTTTSTIPLYGSSATAPVVSTIVSDIVQNGTIVGQTTYATTFAPQQTGDQIATGDAARVEKQVKLLAVALFGGLGWVLIL